MKRVLSSIVLICFIICSLGLVSFAEGVTELKNYNIEATFTGVEKGKLVTIFVLKDGYTLSDLSASRGSVLDKVYYTNMYEIGTSGKFTGKVTVPSEALGAQCVIACEGTMKTGALREFMTGGDDLKIIYAAPNGSSSGSGTKASPYTLSKAAQQAGVLTKQGYNVEVAMIGGTYSLQGTRIQLDDSNEKNVGTGKRITFRPATPSDKPVLTSMKSVGSKYITKVTDNTILSKVPENSRGMIYKLDMEAAGFAVNQVINTKNDDGTYTDTGKRYNTLSMRYTNSADDLKTDRSIEPPILYLNGKRQMLSRYPNTGTISFDIVDCTGTNANGNPTLSYKDSSVSSVMDFGKWPQESLNKAFLAGFLHDTYRAAVAKITNVDTTNKKITIDGTHPFFYSVESKYWGIIKYPYGPRVAVVNLLEEMDVPGEYYVDTTNYCIYYYAPYELTENDVFEMANDKYDSNGVYSYPNLLFISGAENLTFEGIEFYGSRNSYPIYVTGANGIEFRNCTIHATASHGISAQGSNFVVEGCNIYDVGMAGIHLSGKIDYRKVVGTSNNLIENNHIYNYGMNLSMGSTSMSGINIGQRDSQLKSFGDTVRNNLIHANPATSAISYKGLRMNIERNEVYNVLDSVDDAGVIYSGRTLNEFGNHITENYIHDFGVSSNPRYVNMGIYWDDFMSGQTATRNIIVGNQPSNSSLLGARTIGVDNLFENNIVVGLSSGLRLGGRSQSSFRTQNSSWGLVSSLNNLPYYTSEDDKYERYDDMVALKNKFAGQSTLTMDFNGKAIENLTVDCSTPINTSSYTSYYKDGTHMIDNVTGNYDIFVDAENQDYRVKASAITAGTLTKVPNENNFNMDLIGIQKEMPYADQSFKLMYPARGELVDKSSVVLTWEQALFADEYDWVVSSDSSFSKVVASGTTESTLAVPNTTLADGTYYWKVTAKNISRNMGKSWNATNTGTFQVGKGMTLQIIDNKVLSADGKTNLTSLNGVKDFDVNYAIYNTADAEKDYVVIGALFSNDGKFQQARVSAELKVPANQAITGTLEFFSSTEAKDGYYVKTFVVNTKKRLDPMSFFDEILKK